MRGYSYSDFKFVDLSQVKYSCQCIHASLLAKLWCFQVHCCSKCRKWKLLPPVHTGRVHLSRLKWINGIGKRSWFSEERHDLPRWRSMGTSALSFPISVVVFLLLLLYFILLVQILLQLHMQWDYFYYFCVLLSVFLELFESTLGDPPQLQPWFCCCNRDQLLALCNPAFHSDSSRVDMVEEKRLQSKTKVPREETELQTILPLHYYGNISPFPGKIEKLTPLIWLQGSTGSAASCVLCTAGWTNWHQILWLPWMDLNLCGRTGRTVENCRKRKGGGLAVFIHQRWCNPAHISAKDRFCTKDTELLAVGIWTYSTLRYFFYVIVFNVYIPPAAVCELRHSTSTHMQTTPASPPAYLQGL